MLNRFDQPVRTGVYAIPIVINGPDQGKILFKTSDPENRGKSESGNIVLSQESQNIGLILSILMLAQKNQRLENSIWELVSGAVKQGETQDQAMLRELEEEMGIISTPERLISLEPISPFDQNWLASIIVQQVKKGQPLTIQGVGYIVALFESDLQTFEREKPNADYVLVDQQEILAFIFNNLLDKNMRPSTALYVIDYFANPQKYQIMQSVIKDTERSFQPEGELLAAGD